MVTSSNNAEECSSIDSWMLRELELFTYAKLLFLEKPGLSNAYRGCYRLASRLLKSVDIFCLLQIFPTTFLLHYGGQLAVLVSLSYDYTLR